MNVVHGLVGGGVGIQVAAILHTDGAQVLLKAIVLEMLRAIEGHVLEQVSETPLVVVLLHRTHSLGDIETGHMLRIVVVADVISQAIVQLSLSHLGVDGNGLSLCSNAEQQ